jgi:hypothetical protein
MVICGSEYLAEILRAKIPAGHDVPVYTLDSHEAIVQQFLNIVLKDS